jgi:hypothetical protein
VWVDIALLLPVFMSADHTSKRLNYLPKYISSIFFCKIRFKGIKERFEGYLKFFLQYFSKIYILKAFDYILIVESFTKVGGSMGRVCVCVCYMLYLLYLLSS